MDVNAFYFERFRTILAPAKAITITTPDSTNGESTGTGTGAKTQPGGPAKATVPNVASVIAKTTFSIRISSSQF
jgi:hypothetical protein